jgi:hypothetical protein
MKKIYRLFWVVFISIGFLSFSLPAVAARQKALLIGVGTYQHLPYINSKGEKLDNLKGPGNDVQKIKNLLIANYGFNPADILLLKDREATKEAIFKNFDHWLVQGTKPGDLAIFYFSGHGTRIFRGDQVVYKAICPHDVLLKAKNLADAKLIINEELGDLLSKLKGREVVVIMDSCHSGGMTRSIRGTTVVQLEQTPAVQSKFLPVEITDENISEQTRGKGLPAHQLKSFDMSEGRIAILSSREDQMSVELALPTGIVHGAFTAAIGDVIEKTNNISYMELFEQSKKTIKDKFRLEQDPQLKPNKGKLLTYIAFKPNLANQTALEAQTSNEGKPTQSAVSPSLKPKITAQKPKPPKPSSSVVEVPPPPKLDQAVHDLSPLEPQEVKVLLRLDPIPGSRLEDVENLRKNLEKIPYIELVSTDFFDCLLRGEFRDSQFDLRLLTPMGDGEKIPPSEDIEILISRLIPQLEYTYLLKKLTQVNNPHPPFKVKIRMIDKDRRNYRAGEKALFSFSSEKDCYLIMLNLDSRGNIHILFPNQYFKDNFIGAKQIVEITNKRMGKKFELEFGEPVGEELVKVIATEKPLSLEDLGFSKTDLDRFNPQGLISVPKDLRSIMVKKVEAIPAEKVIWSEDSIVIRSYKQ